MSTSLSTAAPVEQPLPQTRSTIAWTAVVSAIAIAAAHLPLVWSYLVGLLELPHYGFVLLLPFGAAILAWGRVTTLGALKAGSRAGFIAWMLPAVLGLLASTVRYSPWFGAVSFLFALMGVAHAVGGARLVWALLPSWCVLAMGIRLPLNADIELAQLLQRVAAYRADDVLNTIGVLHMIDGNVVETPVKRYMVEQACSGVQSLFAITACTVFFALWMGERVWRTLLLLVAAWWWVWVANVVRVVLVTYLNSEFGIPVDEGWMHEAFGVVLFITTLGLIISTEHLILFFLPRAVPEEDRRSEEAKRPVGHGRTVWPALSKTRLASVALASVYVFLALGQWLPYLRAPRAVASPAQLQSSLTADFAPPRIGGWQLVEGSYESIERTRDSQWGRFTQHWAYQKGTQRIIVSVDYPFNGWHELTECYEATGWDRLSRDVVTLQPTAGAAAPSGVQKEQYVRAAFRRPENGDYGYLLFESFSDRQAPVPAPAQGREVLQRFGEHWRGFVDRVTTLGASGAAAEDLTETYQLQIFMTGITPSTEQDRTEAAQAFTQFRELMRVRLAGGASP